MKQLESMPSSRGLLSGAVFAILCAQAFPTHADTGAGDTPEPALLGDIIVTATKRGESSVQDVPMSIQALSGADLDALGAADFNDFFRQIPGLTAEDTGPGDKRYIIRGINAAGAGTVGVYLDEAVITGENSQDGSGEQADIKLFDIDRIEVLKGPQGTTFGSSSLAGTIRYITNKPVLNQDSGYINTEMVATDGAAPGYQADGAFNLSVIPDRLAIRLAGFSTYIPGYIDSRFESGVNDERTNAARLSTRLVITDDLTLTAMAMDQRIHQDGKSYYELVDFGGNPAPGRFYQTDTARSPFDDESRIFNTTLEYKKAFGTITGTASRFVSDLEFTRDASPFADLFLGLPYDGAGRSVISQPQDRRLDSYELRYASEFSGPINLLVGLYGSDERRNFRSRWVSTDADGFASTVDPAVYLDRTTDDRVRERAVFGEITYDFLDAFKFTVGGRYYDFRLTETTDDLTSVGGGAGSGPGVPSKVSYDGFIPRFNLAYRLNENVNAYVQIAKGFRAGGNNDQTAASLAGVTIPAGFAPDTLWNYETGLKTTWFDRKLLVDASVYYIDWSNIQIQLETSNLGPGTAQFPYTGNGGGAHVKGAEAQVIVNPFHGLNINLSANYNLARLSQTNAPPAAGNEGDRLPFVPQFALASDVNYEFPLASSGYYGTLGGDVSYTGNRATDFNSSLSDYFDLPAYTLLGLRAGVKWDQYSLTLMGSNILNENKIINVTALAFGATPNQYYINRPRTITLRLSAKF